MLLGLASLAPSLNAQRTTQPSDTLLAGITARGRELAAYDAAAWRATDAFVAAKPDVQGLEVYVVERHPTRWVVSFGRLSPDTSAFLIRYDVIGSAAQDSFHVVHYPDDRIDSAYARDAALAHRLATTDFGAPSQRYNVAVLPASQGEFWVYMLPASMSASDLFHGGDVRYRIRPADRAIVEKRRMHNAIINFGQIPDSAAHGMHTAVLDDVPEDSDVFYVLTRPRRMNEYVITEHYVYRIDPAGEISWERRVE